MRTRWAFPSVLANHIYLTATTTLFGRQTSDSPLSETVPCFTQSLSGQSVSSIRASAQPENR